MSARAPIGKLVDHRRSANLNTAIVVIDADTTHGTHFQQVIPWSPIPATALVVQIVQCAGGVVHA